MPVAPTPGFPPCLIQQLSPASYINVARLDVDPPTGKLLPLDVRLLAISLRTGIASVPPAANVTLARSLTLAAAEKVSAAPPLVADKVTVFGSTTVAK